MVWPTSIALHGLNKNEVRQRFERARINTVEERDAEQQMISQIHDSPPCSPDT